jgi:protein arginine kinase
MNVGDFIRQSGAWLAISMESSTVVSSRVRLARNLRDTPFPAWAGEEECERIWHKLRPMLAGLKGVKPALDVSMADLDALDKQILVERHLISREHAERSRGSGLIARHDESVAIMVNEEDHLRLQAMRPGLDLFEAWKKLDGVDSEIEEHVRYAFSTKWGYLTACPTNVGTGIRASVMLHLPALVFMDEVNPIVKGMGKIGLAVRGLWGEGTEATGNLFQISNQITLGDKETNIIQSLEQIVLELVEHEKNARARLMERKEVMVRDHVGRALGILSNAHLLTTKEALDLLSALRLGADLGILTTVNRKVIEELLLLTQPGHLQKIEGKTLKPKERDRARADLVRSKLVATEGKSRQRSRYTHE